MVYFKMDSEFSTNITSLKEDLLVMLEKVKKIEAQLIQEIRSQVSEIDFYKPDADADAEAEMPPKKRMKHSFSEY